MVHDYGGCFPKAVLVVDGVMGGEVSLCDGRPTATSLQFLAVNNRRIHHVAFGICLILEYRSWNAMFQLYKTLGRMHLDYCVQF